jgi:hypothetical protein
MGAMMEGRMIQILRDHADDTRFAPIIAIALNLIHSARVERDGEPTMLLQSSRSVAELHAFRKQSGYYKDGAVIGLDETIAALTESDVPVRAGLVETDKGYVATWLDERDSPLGVMIFMANSLQGRSMESAK